MYRLTEWLSLENAWSPGTAVPPAWRKQKHWKSVDGIPGNAYETNCACLSCVSLGGSSIKLCESELSVNWWMGSITWSFTLDHERFTGHKVQCLAFSDNKIHFNSYCSSLSVQSPRNSILCNDQTAASVLYSCSLKKAFLTH